MKHLALFVLGLCVAVPAAAQPDSNERLTQPGPWQNTYDLARQDPRIRTRGGAALMQLTVMHDRGASTAQVTWTTDRAICENPLEPPCETIGQSGDARARLIGNDLVFAAKISPDLEDPTIIVLRGPPAASTATQPSGYMMNASADYAYRFTWTARFPIVGAPTPPKPKTRR
jgi:hypothetical protein